jgi:hypothetical protein
LAGDIARNIIIASNDPVNTSDTIDVLIHKEGVAIFDGPVSCVDFGKILTGATVNEEFEISNSGCDTLFINNIVSSTDFAANGPAYILPGDEDQVIATIIASADSVYVDEVFTIQTNVGDFDVCIAAESVSNDAESFISMDTLDITINCTNFENADFYIKNNGAVDLDFNIDIQGSITDIVSLSETSGTLVQDDSLVISVEVGGERLLTGTYTGMFVIFNNESVYNPDTIHVVIVDSHLYVESLELRIEKENICLGDTINITANEGFFFEYLWNTGSVEQSIDVATENNYYVDVVDYNGCVFSDSAYLAVHQPVIDLGEDQSICAGSNTELDAGGTDLRYNWSTSETTRTITVDVAGEYSVLLTDAYECVNSDTIVVTVNDLPVVDLGTDQVIKDNQTVTLDAGSFSTYNWNTGETTQSIVVDGSVTGVGTFTYDVVVTDENGCSNADSVDVEVTE